MWLKVNIWLTDWSVVLINQNISPKTKCNNSYLEKKTYI